MANKYLVAAAVLFVAAALAHVGCIVFGGDWYRLLGAGEQMAQMAEAGLWYPTVVTGAIVLLLLLWAMFSLSGANVVKRLPFTRVALVAIASILLLRAVAFLWLMPMFPGNSMTFWWVSSAVCLLMGALVALGTYQRWHSMSGNDYVTRRSDL
ncbi:hypothetical protein [Gilvimarinus agarilyticus]|uniref:hypothetical protein n=1 Tax=Gilvimarinus agarilyticus TaxID=679259 RepID=UPI0005A06202|nr:hypothetical protein [Gilvimarinus agarilyticus]